MVAAKARDGCKSGEKDAQIAARFFASPFCEAQTFFLYLSVRSEVGTDGILKELLKRNKRVLVPRIVGREMVAAPYGELVRGAYGIPAPPAGEDTPCDVALVPMLAFDARGARLGYGGGYYDRYFRAHPSVLRVGLAYAGQAFPRLPQGEGDVPLQYILTENETLSFGKLDRPRETMI